MPQAHPQAHASSPDIPSSPYSPYSKVIASPYFRLDFLNPTLILSYFPYLRSKFNTR